MIRTIIVENERKHIKYLEKLLSEHFPEVNIIARCESVSEGIKKVLELHPELIFLDIKLGPDTGFDLLEETNNKGFDYEVVFTTSYDEYAIRAIKFSALDYIEKPFGLNELKESIERYKNKIIGESAKKFDALLHNIHSKDKLGQSLGIPIPGGAEFVKVNDIIRVEGIGNLTKFYLVNESTISSTKTLKLVEELLENHDFFRVHKEHLINLNHIQRYTRGGEGGFVKLTNGHEVNVSRRGKDGFIKILKERKMLF